MQANALDARLPASGFRAVYRENLPLVRATIRRLGVPSWLEDDAVQDVFVVAHRRLDDFDGDRIDGWLVVIARRVAFRHRRSAQRHRRKLDALRTWMGFAPPERPWQAPEARVLLREMTRRLAAEQQQAFAWCEVEGYTAIEASQRYGVNPNTVSTRLRAARHELRRALVELPIDAAPRPGSARAHGLWLLWPRLLLGKAWPAAAAASWALVTAVAVISIIASFDRAAPMRRPSTAAPVVTASAPVPPPSVAAPVVELPAVAAPELARPEIPAPVARATTIRTPPPPAIPALPLLGAEQLAEAWRRLAAGEYDAARRLLDDHQQRHPDSPLDGTRARLRARLDAARDAAAR
ncbi:MAG: sigma-70 family RNA polymerase sigma factor [Deltaproteobacteria bacterium]|nr:sigma-70 family RNA polymerase sigma factor [Deltaproteobacteria bacterium]